MSTETAQQSYEHGDKTVKIYKPYGGKMAIKIKTIAKLHTKHTQRYLLNYRVYRQILRGERTWHI